MWHKFSNIDTDTFDEYPPEGITVKVTDGRTIDEAYFIYSGSYRWVKIDYDLDDEVEMTIQPTHWMYEKDYIKYKREQRLEELLR